MSESAVNAGEALQQPRDIPELTGVKADVDVQFLVGCLSVHRQVSIIQEHEGILVGMLIK